MYVFIDLLFYCLLVLCTLCADWLYLFHLFIEPEEEVPTQPQGDAVQNAFEVQRRDDPDPAQVGLIIIIIIITIIIIIIIITI